MGTRSGVPPARAVSSRRRLVHALLVGARGILSLSRIRCGWLIRHPPYARSPAPSRRRRCPRNSGPVISSVVASAGRSPVLAPCRESWPHAYYTPRQCVNHRPRASRPKPVDTVPDCGFGVAYAASRVSIGLSATGTWSGSGRAGSGPCDSSMPSARLEQDAHRFGLRERRLPLSGMGSPQQMQTQGFILRYSQLQLRKLQAVIKIRYCTFRARIPCARRRLP
jgi:hypothetical protein